MLANTAVAVNRDGLRVRVGCACAGLSGRVLEGCRALCCWVAGAGSRDVVRRYGGGAWVNGRLLVVETQRRVVTDDGSVEESRWVAEGKVWDDRDFWGWVSRVRC
jgi:hypothetical protein